MAKLKLLKKVLEDLFYLDKILFFIELKDNGSFFLNFSTIDNIHRKNLLLTKFYLLRTIYFRILGRISAGLA
ncbi:hypothetical protein ES705_44439 [subsurface metagenome]